MKMKQSTQVPFSTGDVIVCTENFLNYNYQMNK